MLERNQRVFFKDKLLYLILCNRFCLYSYIYVFKKNYFDSYVELLFVFYFVSLYLYMIKEL